MNNSIDKDKRIAFLEDTVRRLLRERTEWESKALNLKNKLEAYELSDILKKNQNNDTVLLNQLEILIRPKIHEIKNLLINIELVFNKISEHFEAVKTETGLLKLKESLKLGRNSIERIKRNIIDLSYLGGKIPDELIKINIKDLVKENIKFIQNYYKDCRIDINLQNSPTIISGCRDFLDQIITNLTINAIEACRPSEGHIIVTVKKDEKNSQFFNIVVKDNGCGIQPNDIDKIYDLHYTTKKTGFGIGLYLVRTAVKLLNGKIMCESIPDSGTTFTVSLPISQDKSNDITENSSCR